MKYYPINLDLKNRKCLVVGGGSVALRKVRGLLASMAQVSVVGPEAVDALIDLSNEKRIELELRPYQSSDLNGVFLVIGATDNQIVNRRISEDARRQNIMCNIVDQPRLCSFILPAVVDRGDLILAVSTSGKSPAFAKWMRKQLEKQFGPEYATFLQLVGAIRSRMISESLEPEAHKHLFETLFDSDLIGLHRRNDTQGIDRLLRTTFGAAYTYESLLPDTNRDDNTLS